MGIFADRRTRRDQQLAVTIATAVAQHLEQLQARPKVDVNAALETLVVKKAESENAGASSSASILMEAAKTVMEYAMDSAFRRSRRPGGKARAATAQRKRGKFANNCRLCVDPLIGNPTIEEILEHARHNNSGVRQIEVTKDAVVATVDENALVEHPDGHGQVLECDNCGPDGRKLN